MHAGKWMLSVCSLSCSLDQVKLLRSYVYHHYLDHGLLGFLLDDEEVKPQEKIGVEKCMPRNSASPDLSPLMGKNVVPICHAKSMMFICLSYWLSHDTSRTLNYHLGMERGPYYYLYLTCSHSLVVQLMLYLYKLYKGSSSREL